MMMKRGLSLSLESDVHENSSASGKLNVWHVRLIEKCPCNQTVLSLRGYQPTSFTQKINTPIWHDRLHFQTPMAQRSQIDWNRPLHYWYTLLYLAMHSLTLCVFSEASNMQGNRCHEPGNQSTRHLHNLSWWNLIYRLDNRTQNIHYDESGSWVLDYAV